MCDAHVLSPEMVLAPRAKNGVLGAGLQGKSGVHPVHPAQLAIAGYRTETWHLDVPEVVKRRGYREEGVWARCVRAEGVRASASASETRHALAGRHVGTVLACGTARCVPKAGARRIGVRGPTDKTNPRACRAVSCGASPPPTSTTLARRARWRVCAVSDGGVLV